MLAPVRQGLRTLDQGRWIEYGPDVLDKKTEIETRWPELKCIFDTVDMEWSIIQENKDGSGQSLALGQTFKRLDGSVVRRLERADEYSRSVEDLEHAVDSHNSSLERASESRMLDITGDAGERLIHAFRKDGIYDHMNIYGPAPRRGIANRAIRSSNSS